MLTEKHVHFDVAHTDVDVARRHILRSIIFTLVFNNAATNVHTGLPPNA